MIDPLEHDHVRTSEPCSERRLGQERPVRFAMPDMLRSVRGARHAPVVDSCSSSFPGQRGHEFRGTDRHQILLSPATCSEVMKGVSCLSGIDPTLHTLGFHW